MWPNKTYLDIADTSYSKGKPLEIRRKWGRIRVRDSNTAGRDYLRIDVMEGKYDEAFLRNHTIDDCTDTVHASIRLTRAEARRVYAALGRFFKRSDEWRGKPCARRI